MFCKVATICNSLYLNDIIVFTTLPDPIVKSKLGENPYEIFSIKFMLHFTMFA